MSDEQACTTRPAALAVVLFSAGGWRIGIEACRVRGSAPAPQASGARAVETLLGIAPLPDDGHARQSLRLKREDGDQEIQVDGPVELVELPVAAIQPVPPLVVSRSRLPGLRALVLPPPGEAAASPILLLDAGVF